MSESHTQTTPLRLIHHAAQRGAQQFPPSSLAAIQDCLDAGALAIEVDILPLGDGHFALLHDPDLSHGSDGCGNACLMSRADLSPLHYLHQGTASPHRIAFLDDAIALVAAHPTLQKFQLDLKPQTPLTPSLIASLLHTIQPAFERIQVSSVADWAIRGLRHFAPTLDLGFDPLLYLDVLDDEPRPPQVPPFRVGAYGLLDDHPLSAYTWGPPADYFTARAEALFNQAVSGCEWYIRAETLLQALASGFNWPDFLHQRGCRVDAWTIDPPAFAIADKMALIGVDEITSNAPQALAAGIQVACRY